MSNWRSTSQYRLWRIRCKQRDGFVCRVTGLNEDLQVHHLNSGSYFPEERYDINNGITLHESVHAEFHIAYMKGYRKKCTKKDWSEFIDDEKYKNRRFVALLRQLANQIEGK